MKKVLLSLAGYDPSGGAGVLLDVKVFEHFGFHGAAVLTALTVQNTKRVKRVHGLKVELVQDQYQHLRRDLPLAGIKVGMLGALDTLALLGRILSRCPDLPRVVDPVFRSSSGAWLFEKEAVAYFLKTLRRKMTILTPNLVEASLLADIPVRTVRDMKEAAQAIAHRAEAACLVKGGHLKGRAVDVLYDGMGFTLFKHPRVAHKVHGTGCFLSASMLCLLARGELLDKACGKAIRLTHRAIKKAKPLGQGQALISFPLEPIKVALLDRTSGRVLS